MNIIEKISSIFFGHEKLLDDAKLTNADTLKRIEKAKERATLDGEDGWCLRFTKKSNHDSEATQC